MKDYIELLGLYCTDKITNFEGYITSITFDVSGNILVQVDSDKELGTKTFDILRLKIFNGHKIMKSPDFITRYDSVLENIIKD
jgi:hypothetical protein